MEKIGLIESKINYNFKDKQLLLNSMTHSSYCREFFRAGVANNERLEFLGDAFLDAIISDILYRELEQMNEGKMSKLRAIIVCEHSLATIAEGLGIGEFLFMGRGEIMSGGRKKESILADALEALIGAIFLDGGYYEAEKFVSDNFKKILCDACSGKIVNDYKTKLQETLQKKDKNVDIRYVLDSTEGPEHNKTFFMSLIYNGNVIGHGVGKSKKEAEQRAAQQALEGGISQDVL